MADQGRPERCDGDGTDGFEERVNFGRRSPEYQLFLGLLKSRSLAQVPGAVRAWWQQAGQRARLIALLLLPIVASLASGIIAVALVLLSVMAQFVVVPTLVALSIVGYGVAIAAGCVSLTLFCVVAVAGTVGVFGLLVFGCPVIMMHLSNKKKREEALASVNNGLASFRRSFREALRKAQMEQRTSPSMLRNLGTSYEPGD